MSKKDLPTVNSVGQTDDGIVFEIDRQTAARLVDEWRMFDDVGDAVEQVVDMGVDELDSLRDMVDEPDATEPAWRRSR